MQVSANEHDFQFGPVQFNRPEVKAFWGLHEPVVRAWIQQMQAAGDPWWQSANHAAYCLVSHREFEAELYGSALDWNELDVERFLFHDLHEGGTVGFFGSVEIFFDQLVEGLSRFVAAGIVEPRRGKPWLEQMRAARPRFLEYYKGCDDAWDDEIEDEDTGDAA